MKKSGQEQQPEMNAWTWTQPQFSCPLDRIFFFITLSGQKHYCEC